MPSVAKSDIVDCNIIIDPNKCTHCGRCVEICSEDVFFGSVPGEVPTVTYPEECIYFNCCVYECPVPGAIRLRIPLPMSLLYKDEEQDQDIPE